MKTPSPKNLIDLSHEAPDYGAIEAAPAGKPKKQKMKKVHPSLVVKNHPELTKHMKVGKKYHVHAIVSPSLIRTQQGQEKYASPGDTGNHHAEFDVHSMAPMGPVDNEPDEDDGKQVPPNFDGLK